MNLEYQEVKEIVEKIEKERTDLFQRRGRNWYTIRKIFLEENEKFLDVLAKELEEKKKKITTKKLFLMQKLYLLYPNDPPEKLLSLKEEQIECIIDLCSKEKREFYTEICYSNEIDMDTLKDWILKDLYEKVLTVLEELPKEEEKNDFLDKVLEILPMIWQ